MKNKKFHQQNFGFTAVELLITLFIAAIFLIAGYTLYSSIINQSGEAQRQTEASNIAYAYLRQYQATISSPCTSSTPVANATLPNASPALTSARISVTITCPQASIPSLTRIQSTITYSDGEQITHAIYSTQ